jgi:PAS domain S-box-containing protein
MNEFPHDGSGFFDAFIKSAQYIVRLQTQQDIWDHLGKFITTYFPVGWTAFVRRDAEMGISIHLCTPADEIITRTILAKEVRTIISDVLDSGFLASHIISTLTPSMTVFLPIVEQGQPEMVMLISHKSDDPISRELLNIYLAIAGIAGSTSERLKNEVELKKHRAHLEELVKERTAELAKAKRQNELILHSVGEGICGLDLDGNITFINPSAARIFGWEPDELIGKNAHTAFHNKRPDGSFYPQEQCPIHSALHNDNTEHCTNTDSIMNEEFVRKDGALFPVDLTMTSIIEEEKLLGAVMVFRDITERKLAEEALKKAHEELEQHADRLGAANKELEDFGYSISHDLRSPLRAIAGFTQMILDDNEKAFNPETRRKFGIIQENAQRMGRLIDDLLRLSRLGRTGLSRSKLDMGSLVREVLAEIRMAERDREFIAEIGELPPAHADITMIRQLLANLLSNAVKFTRNKESARIEVDSFDTLGERIYYVKDNGVGFDMKYYNKLFGVFQRLVSDSQFEGTGAGLAIVERIVQRHGGRVWAEGKLGEGATFYFVLPPKEQG